jgi:hypothetical protein
MKGVGISSGACEGEPGAGSLWLFKKGDKEGHHSSLLGYFLLFFFIFIFVLGDV